MLERADDLSLEDIRKDSDIEDITVSFQHTHNRARMKRNALERQRKGVARTRRSDE
jgi:hypothetical protein